MLTTAILLAGWRYYKSPVRWELDLRVTKAIFAMIAAFLLSAFLGVDIANSLDRTVSYAYRMAPLFLAVAFIRKRCQIETILLTLAGSLLIADLVILWQGLHGNWRAAGFTSNAAIMAGYLVPIISLSLCLAFNDQNFSQNKRRFWGLVFFLSIIALIFNGTRGAWLAILGVFLLYGIMGVTENRKRLIGLLVLVALLAGLYGAVPKIQDRTHTISNLAYASNSERLLLWQSAWNMFCDYPLAGVGIGNFGPVYQSQYISPEAKEPHLSHAHSNFPQIAAETGVVGLAVFLYLFGTILYVLRKLWQERPNGLSLGCFLATCGFLLQGLTDYTFGHSTGTQIYWLLLGLTLASRPIFQVENKQKNEKIFSDTNTNMSMLVMEREKCR